MSPCSLGAVPTGFGTGVGVHPAGWRPGQSCVWILARVPRGQRSQKDVSTGKGRPMPFWARGAAEATAGGLRPVDSGLGFPSVPRWSQAVLAARPGVPGTRTRNGPGGGRQRPPGRAPSSRPLLFIGNTLGAARALWWRLPAKGRRGHAFRHSQSRVLIHVSTTHRYLISLPHPLPAVPTPQDSREHLDSGPWEMTGRQGVGTVQ